jgi:hypothetical protein
LRNIIDDGEDEEDAEGMTDDASLLQLLLEQSSSSKELPSIEAEVPLLSLYSSSTLLLPVLFSLRLPFMDECCGIEVGLKEEEEEEDDSIVDAPDFVRKRYG